MLIEWERVSEVMRAKGRRWYRGHGIDHTEDDLDDVQQEATTYAVQIVASGRQFETVNHLISTAWNKWRQIVGVRLDTAALVDDAKRWHESLLRAVRLTVHDVDSLAEVTEEEFQGAVWNSEDDCWQIGHYGNGLKDERYADYC